MFISLPVLRIPNLIGLLGAEVKVCYIISVVARLQNIFNCIKSSH